MMPVNTSSHLFWTVTWPPTALLPDLRATVRGAEIPLWHQPGRSRDCCADHSAPPAVSFRWGRRAPLFSMGWSDRNRAPVHFNQTVIQSGQMGEWIPHPSIFGGQERMLASVSGQMSAGIENNGCSNQVRLKNCQADLIGPALVKSDLQPQLPHTNGLKINLYK